MNTDLLSEYDIPCVCWNCMYLVDDYNVSEDYSDEWLVFYCDKDHSFGDIRKCKDKTVKPEGISI